MFRFDENLRTKGAVLSNGFVLKTVICIALLGIVVRGQPAVAWQRTVVDNEYGQYYGFGPDPKQVGMAVLQPHSSYFMNMPRDAIKVPHGHFQHFAANDPGDDFPFAALKRLEASELAAGRPPILVTATYAGRRRPVYFAWSLQPDNANQPSAPSDQWAQAVNLGDDRFVRFFADAYVRSTMWKPWQENVWHATDNCSFRYEDYGVIDDQGIFQKDIVWDRPFAQNDGELLNSIKYFLARLKEIAPDIHIVGNEGSMSEEDRFTDVWSGFDGTIREDITNSFAGDTYSRNQLFRFYQRYQWEGPAGKAALLRALLPASSNSAFQAKLRTSYVAYLVFRGPNFFFGPRFDDATATGVPPSSYSAMRARLGLPSAPAESSSATNDGFRLYCRRTSGGIVYLNWTGKAQTIRLPSGDVYYNRDGKRVHSLSIPDLDGDYVLLERGARAETPAVNPRFAGPVSGRVQVTLSALSGETIRYTLDGSTPSSRSSLYTSPISLAKSATIKAKAFRRGCLESFIASVAYTVSSEMPVVQFFTSSGVADGFGFPDYALVQLDRVSGETVTVQYQASVPGFQGALTFNPGESVKAIPIAIPNTQATVWITLFSPRNATLGANNRFAYGRVHGM
jgi:Chitobiase/beta-hexosaminidase C-terminal domain